jgi:hypothetical protein
LLAIVIRLYEVRVGCPDKFVKILFVHFVCDCRADVVVWLKPFCNIIVVIMHDEEKLSVTCTRVIDDAALDFPIPVAAHVV